VKATLDNNVIRLVELERQKYDLALLKDKLAKAYGLPSVNIRYSNYFLTNDQQFHKAIKESEKANAKHVEVTVLRDSAGGAAAATASRAVATPAKPAASASPAQSATPASSGAAPAAGILLSYRLPGNPGGAERVNVDAKQSSDHFLFSLLPSKYDTDVDVKLDGTSLLFLTTHTVNEGTTIKTIKGTQGISLPFPPTTEQVVIIGQQVKILFK